MSLETKLTELFLNTYISLAENIEIPRNLLKNLKKDHLANLAQLHYDSLR